MNNIIILASNIGEYATVLNTFFVLFVVMKKENVLYCFVFLAVNRTLALLPSGVAILPKTLPRTLSPSREAVDGVVVVMSFSVLIFIF